MEVNNFELILFNFLENIKFKKLIKKEIDKLFIFENDKFKEIDNNNTLNINIIKVLKQFNIKPILKIKLINIKREIDKRKYSFKFNNNIFSVTIPNSIPITPFDNFIFSFIPVTKNIFKIEFPQKGITYWVETEDDIIEFAEGDKMIADLISNLQVKDSIISLFAYKEILSPVKNDYELLYQNFKNILNKDITEILSKEYPSKIHWRPLSSFWFVVENFFEKIVEDDNYSNQTKEKFLTLLLDLLQDKWNPNPLFNSTEEILMRIAKEYKISNPVAFIKMQIYGWKWKDLKNIFNRLFEIFFEVRNKPIERQLWIDSVKVFLMLIINGEEEARRMNPLLFVDFYNDDEIDGWWIDYMVSSIPQWVLTGDDILDAEKEEEFSEVFIVSFDEDGKPIKQSINEYLKGGKRHESL